MKKHRIVCMICFLIAYSFLLSNKSGVENNENFTNYIVYKNNIRIENVSIVDAIKNFEVIKYFEEEREVIENTEKYTIVYKIIRVKIPSLVKYLKVFIRPKFRVQSARSILGDEGFANI